MEKRFFLMLCLCATVCSTVYAQQSWSPYDNEPTDPMSGYNPAPQTWEFVKYGNTPVDLYTGTARVDIPIYLYSDRDFDLSVGIGYASNGLVPSRQTGILGLNWFLNCGGVITREINGLPDDVMSTGASRYGFMLGNVSYDDNRLLDMEVGGELLDDFHYTVNNTETEPDVFHFNFMGHSGSFMLDGHRNIQVFNTGGNNDTYSIDLHLSGSLDASYIVITTDDGYEYLFGTKEAHPNSYSPYLEYSIKGNYSLASGLFMCSPLSESPIVSWYLAEVKAPNGRKITLEYLDTSNRYHQQSISGPDKNNIYAVSFSDGDNMVGEDAYGGMRYISKYAHIVATTYLSSIEVEDGVRVSFEYSPKAAREVFTTSSDPTDHRSMYANTVQTLLKLDRITVKNAMDTTQLLRACDFYYRTKNNRTIMDSLALSGEGTYKMHYYENHAYPDILTTQVDFWNYYNGTVGWTGATAIENSVTMDEVIVNDQNDPRFEYGVTGCLKRIEYPTKGFTDFEYEGNTAYLAVLKRRSNNSFLEPEPIEPPTGQDTMHYEAPFLARLDHYSTLYPDSNECGGVRIKRITDHDADNGTVVREYRYVKDGHSSGIMLHFPRFYAYREGSLSTKIPLIQSTVNTFDRTHLEYSRVTELRSDGSSIQYDFSCYQTDPDNYEGQCHVAISVPMDNPICDTSYINNIQRKPNSRHYRRGRLLSKTYFDSQNNIVQREEFVYEDHNQAAAVDYVAFTIPAGYNYCSGKIYTGDNRLTDKIVTMYGEGQELSTSEHITYNAKGQVGCMSFVDSEGTVARRYVRYLYEGVSDSDPVVVRHLLSYPSHVVNTLQRNGGAEQLVSALRYDYAMYAGGNLLLPSRTETAEITVPVTVSSEDIFATDVTYATFVEYDAYDHEGNVRQTTDRSGVSTCYVWGYRGRYPLAKLFDITLTEMEAVTGSMETPLNLGLSDALRNTLRSLPATVTLYDYKPHVGLTRMTDFSGNDFYFDYDAFGRLIEKRDRNGIIEQYQYHF